MECIDMKLAVTFLVLIQIASVMAIDVPISNYGLGSTIQFSCDPCEMLKINTSVPDTRLNYRLTVIKYADRKHKFKSLSQLYSVNVEDGIPKVLAMPLGSESDLGFQVKHDENLCEITFIKQIAVCNDSGVYACNVQKASSPEVHIDMIDAVVAAQDRGIAEAIFVEHYPAWSHRHGDMANMYLRQCSILSTQPIEWKWTQICPDDNDELLEPISSSIEERNLTLLGEDLKHCPGQYYVSWANVNAKCRVQCKAMVKNGTGEWSYMIYRASASTGSQFKWDVNIRGRQMQIDAIVLGLGASLIIFLVILFCVCAFSSGKTRFDGNVVDGLETLERDFKIHLAMREHRKRSKSRHHLVRHVSNVHNQEKQKSSDKSSVGIRSAIVEQAHLQTMYGVATSVKNTLPNFQFLLKRQPTANIVRRIASEL